MIKRNKLKLILSSIAILLPSLVILVVNNILLTNYTPLFSVNFIFFMPFILLAIHWTCIFFTLLDPKNKEQNSKVLGMVLLIIPVLSWFICTMFFMISTGYSFAVKNVTMILIALLFIVTGNYMPKCKQNSTIGIKIKPTLTNEENWLLTHRLSGKVWVICGIAMLFISLAPIKFALPALALIIAVSVTVPVIYSYSLYKKQLKTGAQFSSVSVFPFTKKHKYISLAMLLVILVLISVLMFTGKMEVEFTDSDLSVKITYWENLYLDYADIDSAEIRKDFKIGYRTYGYSSAALSAGLYENEEFGQYTLYKEKGAENYLILHTQKGVIVIADDDESTSGLLYEKIKSYNG